MIRHSSAISLPNIRLDFSKKIFREEYLLVAGGRAPSSAWLQAAAVGRTLYCIDHGADACRSASLTPSLYIGDGDSTSADTRDWIEKSDVETKRFPVEKDKTDTQLALDLLQEKNEAFIVLAGGFGGRFDHAFSLLYAFAGTNLHGCIADDHEFLLFLRDEDAVTLQLAEKPKSISLLPLSSVCTDVTIDGVYWPLNGAALRQNEPYAISNRLSSHDNCVTVKNGNGTLALYLCLDESALKQQR